MSSKFALIDMLASLFSCPSHNSLGDRSKDAPCPRPSIEELESLGQPAHYEPQNLGTAFAQQVSSCRPLMRAACLPSRRRPHCVLLCGGAQALHAHLLRQEAYVFKSPCLLRFACLPSIFLSSSFVFNLNLLLELAIDQMSGISFSLILRSNCNSLSLPTRRRPPCAGP